MILVNKQNQIELAILGCCLLYRCLHTLGILFLLISLKGSLSLVYIWTASWSWWIDSPSLRCFVQACPSKWVHWLSVAKFWYNTNFHSSVGRSPFEVLYGHPPRHFGLHSTSAVRNADSTSWLEDREVMTKLVQQHLLRAQDRI